nr:MAG TPA: adenylyl cyclase-associated protein [Caudoviricetes sp.]
MTYHPRRMSSNNRRQRRHTPERKRGCPYPPPSLRRAAHRQSRCSPWHDTA